jgi:hypothetical protein
VPRVGRVDGIAIAIYSFDHQPPHFHALYAEHQALILIADLTTLRGELPPPQMRTVVRWAAENAQFLADCWDRAQRGETIP